VLRWHMVRVPGAASRLRYRWALPALVACLLVVWVSAALPSAAAAAAGKIEGRLLSGKKPLSPTTVTLYRAGSARGKAAALLGRSHSRADGTFGVSYRIPRRADAVLYLIAGRGAAVRAASVYGRGPTPRHVVVNERTTVAAGFALAQFVTGRNIAGEAPGPQNAAGMAHNLANVRTGGVGAVLGRAPNGRQTSTVREFNSLANMLAGCSRSTRRCAVLFRLAMPFRGHIPRGTLAAVANIARNPSRNAGKLFRLARSRPAPYTPALGRRGRPDAWTLALRFVGDGMSMDGPGNSAVDAKGNIWVTNNYTFSRRVRQPACGARIVLEFTPTGRYVRGSPYSGGGLNGAGYGITFDPTGNLWVGNFGFAAPTCSDQPPHNSVSKFGPGGQALSPNAGPRQTGGFTQGKISWPQGTVSDRGGSIWIANCGNSTVTRYPGGDPRKWQSLGGLGITKPFDIAFNGRGQAFVTGVGNSAVGMLNANGSIAKPAITQGGINKPMGIAADSRGNMWVANSGLIDVPCPTANVMLGSLGGTLSLISHDGVASSKSPFRGGGLTVPWGIAVDGNDNVWVVNFFGKRLSQFCGGRPANCPAGKRTGDPISGRRGYGFNGLVRNTGVAIDPSGNAWVTNNWKIASIQTNPGGFEMVAFIGVAGPLKTPLIGPPRPL
jgi:hypothetical protein